MELALFSVKNAQMVKEKSTIHGARIADKQNVRTVTTILTIAMNANMVAPIF